ncbi:hypothetical protein JTB14_027520 [Gonioctena quinquepunctata]|nr:hypothetical protein JTB14_027520 [Gonioctena quinquepunctata]
MYTGDKFQGLSLPKPEIIQYKNRTDRDHASGGVAIYLKSHSISKQIPLNTTLEAVAVEIGTSQKLHICSIYNPPNCDIEENDLRNLAIPNNVANTHSNLASGSSSAIDLSLCSPSILIDHTWRVAEDLHGSDHFPIMITKNSSTKTPHTPEPKWKLDTANWDLFQEHIETKISTISINNSIDNIISQFNEIIMQSASQAVGKTKYIDDKIVPWWNSDCDRTIKQSRKTLNTFKRNNTTYNLIYLKRKELLLSK